MCKLGENESSVMLAETGDYSSVVYRSIARWNTGLTVILQ
jgi:hypothetical protein